MMREAVLIEVFKRMVQWPNWPAEAEAHLLNSIYEHAEFMNSKRGPGNQDITNSEHLMRVAAAFPEFKNAAPWCDSGFARIKDKIFDDVLEDGAQKELCSGYHLNAITSYTNAMMRVRATGHDVSPDFLKRLEKMYEWCMVMVRPDGGVPTNGDSEGRGAREYLQQGAELFHRPDMAYVASEGKAGTKPDHLDMSLPIAGYYTLRSGWTGQNDLYLFMDISRQPVVSHQYFDALHIALFAYGRDFFPAMGTFTYGGQYHKDARATKNQTTVTIDDRDQGDVPATCNAFASSPALSFLDGSQAGYPGITHRRQVLFVRPAAGCIPYFMVIDRITGSGQHVVDQYFHFPPGKLQAADGRAQTLFPDGANIVVTNLATDGLETTQIETDMHPSQGQTVKRPSVRFRHSGNLPVTYVTLLVPYQGTNPPALNAHLLGNAGAITVQVDQPGGKDVLSVTAAPSRAMLDRTTPQGEQKTELPGKP
jgi:hypothetical protein